MPTTEDIMRQLNKKRRRTADEIDVDGVETDDVADNKVTTEQSETPADVEQREVTKKTEPEPKNSEFVSVANPGTRERTKPMDSETSVDAKPKPGPKTDQPAETDATMARKRVPMQTRPVNSSPEAKIDDSKPVSDDAKVNTPETPNVPKHPDIERTKPKEDFKDLSVFEKLMFKDIFVNEGGEVVFNTNHTKTVAKNLSKGVMDHIVDDLRRKHKGAVVGIGSNRFTIRDTNAVLTSPTSLVRYMMLDKIDDENVALQLARQLFLEKHPDGEKADFDHKIVRTDERDVYAMLLSSKADPERDLAEKIEELIRSMEYLEENTTLSNRRLLEQTTTSNDTLNGLNIAMSLMVLERLGLTEGSLPRNLDDIRGFATQDSIVKMSDIMSNDIASDVNDRKKTLARNERMRQSNERLARRGQPRSIRRGPTVGQDYSR